MNKKCSPTSKNARAVQHCEAYLGQPLFNAAYLVCAFHQKSCIKNNFTLIELALAVVYIDSQKKKKSTVKML